jgi:hypothetical protein
MAQVTIHLPSEPDTSASVDEKKQLAAEILGRYGLSLPGGTAQAFHNVAISDQKMAQSVVAELQSKGITAFLKPATFAP